MDGPDMPRIPVSWGELLDKITILEIKRVRIACPDAHVNVEKELRLLHRIAEPVLARQRIGPLIEALRRVNSELWEIEDAIRAQEARGCFDAAFVALARSVYRKNDRRAALKGDINRLLGSALVEEKNYEGLPRERRKMMNLPPYRSPTRADRSSVPTAPQRRKPW